MPVVIENGGSVPRLIVLRGAPAVGKSTVAAKVASLNSAKKKTYIPIDDFQLYDLRQMSVDREKLAIRNAAILSKSYLLEGFDVVVDYVFDCPDDYVKFMSIIFGDMLGKLDTIYVQKFFLDAPIEKVVKRNQSRSGKRGEYMNLPLLRKLYAKVSDTKGSIKNEICIDTTKYSAKQCAKFILSYQQAYKNDKDFEKIILPEKDLARLLESEE